MVRQPTNQPGPTQHKLWSLGLTRKRGEFDDDTATRDANAVAYSSERVLYRINPHSTSCAMLSKSLNRARM